MAEIRKLAAAGADLVRVTVPDKRDTEALPEILAASPVPIVADVHFHFQRGWRRSRRGYTKSGSIPATSRIARRLAA